MIKKKKSTSWLILFLIIFIMFFVMFFVMCIPQSTSGGSDNNTSSTNWNYIDDTINWNKMFGANGIDVSYSIAIDSNNNVYVVGNFYDLVSGSSGQDWWINNFDSNGNTNWNRMFDGNSSDDYAYSAAIDSNNNVYVVGYGTNLFSSGSSYDWWIKKFYSNGNEDTANWNKIFDGNNSYDYAYSVAIDSNNNIYVVGSGYNLVSSSSDSDWWIKKFDSNGITIWNKMIDGNGGSDKAKSVAIDSNNNVYIVGYGENIVTGITGYDWWIKKFDSNGNEDITNWNKMFDGDYNSDVAHSVAIDSNNNIYVVGYGENIISSSSNPDWWIKKFDSNGNEDTTNWNKIYGSGGYDEANSVTIDSSNNIYVVGYNVISGITGFDWWVKKFNSNGNEDTTNWDKIIDGIGRNDKAYSVAIDLNNNIYIAGFGINLVSSISAEDWWIKKFLKIN